MLRLTDKCGASPLLLMTLVLVLVGCAPFNYDKADAPLPLTDVTTLTTAPRVALVLGSGGPRGYAHIGVLKVLEEAGIEIDLVVGSSVGALVGVFWASGLSADEIDRRSSEGGPLTVFDPNPFADRGWIRGQRLQDFVNHELGDQSIEELARPVIVVATRRDDKRPVFFTSGNSGVAVRASSAVPGIISPVGINGIEYEDGDESLPLAVKVARDAGAEFIIAVNVYPRMASVPSDASHRLRMQQERRHRLISREVTQADFYIHPDTPWRASPRRQFFEASRSIGEAEARDRLSELQVLLQQHEWSFDTIKKGAIMKSERPPRPSSLDSPSETNS